MQGFIDGLYLFTRVLRKENFFQHDWLCALVAILIVTLALSVSLLVSFVVDMVEESGFAL